MNTTLLRRVVFAAIFLTSFGIYVMRASTSGALREPPETGDGHDYDAIAFNVWQGRGFGYQWSDEDWRKPYEGIPRYRLLLTRQSEFYPTTYRPPAMPFLLSAVYAVTGRSFTAWRVVNCGIMAGAVTTAAIISAQFAGIPAAVITAAILLQSRELTRYSGMFMTEPLATLMLALLAWTWVRNASDGWTTRRAIASGIAMGGLLAARTIFILTTPILLILPGRDLSFGSKLAWKTKAICLAVAIVVISPWWIRNIVVLDAFMPLGTQGGINLPMGFGPRALRSQGIWASNPGDGWPEIAALKLDIVTSEVMLAKHRQKLTLNWMMDESGTGSSPDATARVAGAEARARLLFAMAAACRSSCRRSILWKFPGVWVLVLIVCGNILSVAMTYSAGGRFMVPLQPLLAALVAAAVVYGPRQALNSLRGTSAASPRASA